MPPGRAAAVFFGIGLLALWLAAAAGVRGPNEAAPVEEIIATPSASADAVFGGVESHTAQLRTRVGFGPVPRQPARNPFEFAPRAAARRPQPPVVAQSLPDVSVLPVLPPRPVLNLAGIGEDRPAQGGILRTAVISSPSGLFIVKAGDEILGRFVVSAIGADAVELLDRTDGTTFSLPLR